MKIKHKHHDVIIAWLNGEDVQIEEKDCWFNIDNLIVNPAVPNFHNHKNYRIKPRDIVIRKHLACWIDGEGKLIPDKAWTPDTKEPNCEIIFDGATHELKEVKILKKGE